MTPEEIELYEQALKKWGIEAQVMMLFEEMGELMQILSKFYRGKSDVPTVLSEVADVEIMLGQIKTWLFPKDEGYVGIYGRIRGQKLERLQKLIEGEGEDV
jgi:hypothetical protein